MFWDSLFALAI